MDPISGITARLSAIESRVKAGPSPSGGQFGDLLRAELASRNNNGVLGYSATGETPGGSLASAYANLGLTQPSVATSGLTPALRLEPGQYPSLTPPADLVPYGNGKVPAEALTALSVPGHSLYAPAANAFEKMVAAAKADGVTIGVTDSYRPLAVQERLAKEKGLYSQGGLAATPGTSNHGWGLALDLDLDDSAQAWMRAHAPDYGFVEDVPREPWHWTYRPAY
ncbi:MAG: M15 family metallopeptidase [Acidimicrobiales bacterium]